MNIKIKNNKVYLKTIIIVSIFITVISIALLSLSNKRNILYISCKVFLPQPKKIDTIYMHDWREGQDFEIWHYNPKKAKKIISHKKFKSMEVNFVKEKLEKYYELLDGKERKLFKENIKDTILDDKNYYAYIPKKITVGESQYVNYKILILDTKTNNLYVLSHVGY